MRLGGWAGAAAACAVVALSQPHAAAARDVVLRSYTANAQLEADGDLVVDEVLRFEFDGGPYESVERRIPSRRSDGVALESASGDPVTRQRDSGLRVQWRFPACRDTTLEFSLRYRIHGAVQSGDPDATLDWQPFPGERKFAVHDATLQLKWPDDWRLSAARARRAGVRTTPQSVQFAIARLGREQAARLHLEFAAPVLLPPAWQQRRDAQRANAWIVLVSCAAVTVVGLMLVSVQYRESVPPGVSIANAAAPSRPLLGPPGDLPPAFAAALHNGSAGAAGARATLIDLARRGVIAIASERTPTRWAGGIYSVHRRGTRSDVSAWERLLLEWIFAGDAAHAVRLDRALQRLGKHARAFDGAIDAELHRRGAIDTDAVAARERLRGTMGVWLLLAFAAQALAAFVWSRTGPLALVIPLAPVLVAGIAALAASRVPVHSATWNGRVAALRATRAQRSPLPAPMRRWMARGSMRGCPTRSRSASRRDGSPPRSAGSSPHPPGCRPRIRAPITPDCRQRSRFRRRLAARSARAACRRLRRRLAA